MNILILNHNMREHGTYYRAWPIARGLARRGWEVTFVTVSPNRLYRSDMFETEGVEVLETPRWTWPFLEPDDGWGPLGLLTRLRLAKSRRFDWVYSFAHTPNCYLPSVEARRLGARMAVDWCDDFGEGVFPQREVLRSQSKFRRPVKWSVQRVAERWETRMETSILRHAERVTVISQRLRERALEAGVAEPMARIVHSGADLELFSPREATDARRRLGLPEKAPMLSYVANYHPDEEFLLQSLAIAMERNRNLRLAYTGPAFVHPVAAREPLAGRLHSLGRVGLDQVADVICAGDAMLMPMADTPHNRARCPQKLMDCLACGRPIVTNDIGEAGRIVREIGETGYATAADIASYAQGMLQLCNKPVEEKRAMGLRAREAAETRFNWSRVADDIDAFLKRV